MEIIGLVVVSLFSAFLLSWGISVAMSASMIEKGTRKRITLEVFSIGIITLGVIASSLYAGLIL